jgi:uncharacterized protein with FMN-binding domain
MIMKKTFSILLIATFVAYAAFLQLNNKPSAAVPISLVGKTNQPNDNADIALNNQTPSSTAPVSQATPPPAAETPGSAAQPAADAFPNLQAQGQVSIMNNSNNSIQLVKTTRLLTSDGKIFRLSENVSVPAGSHAAAFIYADKNGSAYAIGPSRFSFPGLSDALQTIVYAVSDATLTMARPIAAPANPVATTQPAPAPTPAPKPAPALVPATKPKGQYRDGTYTGDSVDAYYGNIQVAAVIANGKLADVKILDYPQDRRTSQMINGQALPILVSEAVSVQSGNVDAVSGASETSPAFVRSLNSALAQAKN